MLSFIYTKFIYSRKPIGILDRIESNEEPSVLQSIWLILFFKEKIYYFAGFKKIWWGSILKSLCSWNLINYISGSFLNINLITTSVVWVSRIFPARTFCIKWKQTTTCHAYRADFKNKGKSIFYGIFTHYIGKRRVSTMVEIS